jgi:predicted DNA-binding protein (MmcQ/YjbR family)
LKGVGKMLRMYVVICTVEDDPCLAFTCYAEDATHAIEQCENAYPGAYIEVVVRTIYQEEM